MTEGCGEAAGVRGGSFVCRNSPRHVFGARSGCVWVQFRLAPCGQMGSSCKAVGIIGELFMHAGMHVCTKSGAGDCLWGACAPHACCEI